MFWTFRKHLIKALLIVAALFIAISLFTNKGQNKEVEVIEKAEQVSSKKHFVISEEMIMGKLKAKSQIVSMEQPIKKKDTDVDDGFFGNRYTELKVKGNYKMGLNTSDIKVNHIDNATGNVYISLGKPALISLDLPYDLLKFKKTGWSRLSMNEDEQKNFYKSVKKEIRSEIVNDKEILRQADLYNQDVVRGLLDNVGINNIIFE